MKAVRITEPGGPEVLRLEDVDEPDPGPEEVLVDVGATAVNRADLLQRRGLYPAPPGAPQEIPGLEFAGRVSATGDRVRTVKTGDPVMGLLGGGGYAERVVSREELLLPIPERLSMVEAAAVPEVFLTAYDALVRQAEMGVGERVMIHAAGGGVGTAALQVARAAGASLVVGTASASKLRALEKASLPLDLGVDYREESFREAVERATDSGGVDVILDTVGASHWADNVASLAQCGRIVLVGLLGGRSVEVDLGSLLRRRITVIGTVLRSRTTAEKAALTAEFRDRMVPLLATGRLRPVLDRTFPLAEAAAAHRYMAENRNVGKIVLEV